ncbi:MAG: SAM-dependent methyltransferase [Bacillaceae bacterium]|nr:SAM-dependent methyltransferase [Bacillaceae bacterium]
MSELVAAIRSEIENSGDRWMSFYTFMNRALYDPRHGYYMKERPKIGKEGDFYTSVSVGPIFGETLGEALYTYLKQIEPESGVTYHLVEFGGGTGDLALQILRYLDQTYPHILEQVTYVMVEKSPYHRRIQKDKLSGFPVVWVEDIQAGEEKLGGLTGILFSNEFLDAFPVYVVEWQQGKWMEVGVSWDHDRQTLTEVLKPLEKAEVTHYLDQEQVPQKEGYRTEVNLDALTWLESAAEWLDRGTIITIDYGMAGEDYHHPARNKGTLVAYYQHQMAENPYIRVGEQDLTSHINFSALIRRGEACGLRESEFISQSEFLIRHGILDRLQSHHDPDPFSPKAKQNRAIRQLIMPGGMGETFKVLIQRKKP